MYCILCTLCCPNGNFSDVEIPVAFPPKKASCNRVALATQLELITVHAGSFRVSTIHRTLYMDYRIFNLRSLRGHSYACVHIYIHGGCMGTCTDSESTQHLLTRKNSHNFSLCSCRGWNVGSLDLESDALPTEPSHHPIVLCIHD